MVDAWLIILAVVVPFVLLFINLLILAKYVDPEHAKGHWFAKAFVLFGLLLAESAVLLLPLDVGNRTGLVGCGVWNDDCGGLDMRVAWQFVYMIIAILVVFVFPFGIFYYEADDEGLGKLKAKNEGKPLGLCSTKNCRGALCSAFCYTFITVAISLLILGISFIFLRETAIPTKVATVEVGAANLWHDRSTTPTAAQVCGSNGCSFSDETLKFDVTFVTYLAALLTFVGWFIFVIYASIGLVALPLQAINSFRSRPHIMSRKEANLKKKSLITQAEQLLSVGEETGKAVVQHRLTRASRSERRRFKREETTEVNKLRVLVEALEADVEEYQMCEPANYREHYNPITPYCKLIFGIIGAILTLIWVLHIILFILIDPPASQFLNEFFVWFDGWFPFLGTVFVAVFAMYLLLAVIAGNMKFGSRFFLIKVHPMVPGKTLMNSFLFNVGLILLTTLPVVHFCTIAFATYARLTEAANIFGTQVQHMEFFRYFWASNAFIIAMLVIFGLSLIYFWFRPSDRMHNKAVLAAIRKKVDGQNKSAARAVDMAGGASVEMPQWK